MNDNDPIESIEINVPYLFLDFLSRCNYVYEDMKKYPYSENISFDHLRRLEDLLFFKLNKHALNVITTYRDTLLTLEFSFTTTYLVFYLKYEKNVSSFGKHARYAAIMDALEQASNSYSSNLVENTTVKKIKHIFPAGGNDE